MSNELNEKQQVALQSVVELISHALEAGVGVAALTYAIEERNCGLIDLMNKIVQRMYHDPRGLLKARCIEMGAEETAEGMNLTRNLELISNKESSLVDVFQFCPL